MSRGSQRDTLQSKAKGNRLRIMYPLDLKSVAYESEYISTGNISRNISFRLPYLCAIFLKCLFTLRCTRKAREKEGPAFAQPATIRVTSHQKRRLYRRSSIQARTNLCFFLPPPFFFSLSRSYLPRPRIKTKDSRSFKQIYEKAKIAS